MTTVTQVQRPRVYLWPDGTRGSKVDVSRYVQTLTVAKTIHGRAGNWSVTLLPTTGGSFAHIARLADQIRRGRGVLPARAEAQSNGVISIGIDQEGSWLGLIDNVRNTRGLAGRGQQAVVLTGSDFQKTMARDAIVKAQLITAEVQNYVAAIAEVAGPKHSLIFNLPGTYGPEGRDGVPTFAAASVQDVVDWLLETGPAMQVPLLAPLGGTGRPGEFINTDNTVTTWMDGRIYGEAPSTFQGTLWDFVRSLLDEDFYEAWIDSTPQRGAIPRIDLIIRPKPFDEPELDWLPTFEDTGISWPTLRTRVAGLQHHEILQHEVFQEQLGHSDADVFAFYNVSSQHTLIGNPEGLQRGLYYPAVDLHQLRSKGLRAYEGRLSLLGGDVNRQAAGDEVAKEISAEVVEFRNRLLNWYRLNDWFQAGTIQVAGRDNYRAGDPVWLPWQRPMRGSGRGMRYYCIGTTHTFNVGQPYTTTLQLIRGHNASVVQAGKDEIGRLFTTVPDLVSTP